MVFFLELFEIKDVVIIEDEFGVLDKECDIVIFSNNLNNVNKIVDNILFLVVLVE